MAEPFHTHYLADPTAALLLSSLQMRSLRLGEIRPLAQGHTVVSRGPGLKQDLSDSKAYALNNEETQLSA